MHNSSHVHRNRPQPQLPARHPPPRGLAGRQQTPQAHPGQPLRLAPGKNPDFPPLAARRTPRLSPRSARYPKNFAPRPCRSSPPGHSQARPRCHDFREALPGARFSAGHDRRTFARSLFQVGHHAAVAQHHLGGGAGVSEAMEDELYQAMDWLLERQPRIEKKLAARHLREGSRVLYDVSSSYYEGHHCPLAQYGHDRDGRKGLPIIVYGLMTDHEGRPIAVDIYRGNTGDPSTVVDQVNKLRERFHLSRVVLVGDRGMLTQPQIEKLKAYPQMGWITALKSVAIRGLLVEGSLQLSLLDEKNLVEMQSPDYPGERLMVCYNPLLAEERKRKREDLLSATEKVLTRIVKQVERRKKKLLTATEIAFKVGKVLGRYKMGKHFAHQIEDGKLSWSRRVEMIEQEAKLDGIYVIRTSETAEQLSAADTVRGYKSLAQVERAFRSLKGLDLLIRPIRHRTEERVPAHIFLCMLAYYVEWHLRRVWAPLLFEDEELPKQRQRRDPVLPPSSSESAQAKKLTHQTADGLPVQSFATLLSHLASCARVTYSLKADQSSPTFQQVPPPTPLQAKAYELLNLLPVAGN